jgi:hypothetical protein
MCRELRHDPRVAARGLHRCGRGAASLSSHSNGGSPRIYAGEALQRFEKVRAPIPPASAAGLRAVIPRRTRDDHTFSRHHI